MIRNFLKGLAMWQFIIGKNKIIHCKWERKPDGPDDGKVREDSAKSLLNRKDLIVVKRIL